MDVDNQLRDAGRAWRAQNTLLVPRPDITGVIAEDPAGPGRGRAPRALIVALSAVAAVAMIAGGLVITDRANRDSGAVVASPDSPVTPTVPGPTSGAKTAATPSATAATDQPSAVETATAAPTATAPTTAASPSTPPAAGGDFAAVVAASTLLNPATVPDDPGQLEFTTPSGRISCALSDGSSVTVGGVPTVNCSISEQTYQQPTRPADCEYDYGNAFGLSPGRAGELLCLSDTMFSGASPMPTVQYGQRVEHGGFVCVVSEDGVRCATTDLSHGFRVSRASYELF